MDHIPVFWAKVAFLLNVDRNFDRYPWTQRTRLHSIDVQAKELRVWEIIRHLDHPNTCTTAEIQDSWWFAVWSLGPPDHLGRNVRKVVGRLSCCY